MGVHSRGPSGAGLFTRTALIAAGAPARPPALLAVDGAMISITTLSACRVAASPAAICGLRSNPPFAGLRTPTAVPAAGAPGRPLAHDAMDGAPPNLTLLRSLKSIFALPAVLRFDSHATGATACAFPTGLAARTPLTP